MSQWPMRTKHGAKGWFNPLFNLTGFKRGLNKPEIHAGQGKAAAWALLTNRLTARNGFAFSSEILLRIMWRKNSIPLKWRCFNPNNHTRVLDAGNKKARLSGRSTDDHHNSAIYLLQWCNQLLILENKQFRMCDDHCRAKGLRNFFLCPLWCV